MLKEVSANGADADNGDGDLVGLGPQPGDDDDQFIFQDRIEEGEQGKINGKEPGQPEVTLTDLRKDNAAKSWFYEKCIHMYFVDKNPFGAPDT